MTAEDKPIQGFEKAAGDPKDARKWTPVSDRKIRVGIVGYGVCQFGAAFGFQDHPNVTVAAVSDLFPDRCAALAKVCRCEKTYPSLEELVKDDSLEAVFVATDAPSHARHCIEVLKHGKHVASRGAGRVRLARGGRRAVRGGQVERPEVHDVRDVGVPRRLPRHAADLPRGRVRQAGLQRGGVLHYSVEPIASFHDWRVGLPPQWYPTHATAYYVCVSGGSFTEVTCLGMPSIVKELQPGNNRYKNPFGTEIALFRTSEGGMARMGVSWDTFVPGSETGRVYGQRGYMVGMNYTGEADEAARPGTPGPAADRRSRRPRRLARPPHERVRDRDPGGPQAAGGHRRGPEPDGPRHRRPPVGPEGRGTYENPPLSNLNSIRNTGAVKRRLRQSFLKSSRRIIHYHVYP